MPDDLPSDEIGTDRLLGGRLCLRQFHKGHRAGTDAVLLAAAAPVTEHTILDAGAGTGAAGLALALRSPGARLDLLEISLDLCELARQNLALNGLEARGRVICADLLAAVDRRAAGLGDGRADVVLTNPPFLNPAQARVSPDAGRALAHAERAQSGGLEAWMRAVTALLAPGGTLVMIHRADRVADILSVSSGRLGDLQIRPIHPRAEADAIRVLVTGRKGSRAPLRLRPGLVLHEANGRFTAFAEALHRGEALLE